MIFSKPRPVELLSFISGKMYWTRLIHRRHLNRYWSQRIFFFPSGYVLMHFQWTAKRNGRISIPSLIHQCLFGRYFLPPSCYWSGKDKRQETWALHPGWSVSFLSWLINTCRPCKILRILISQLLILQYQFWKHAEIIEHKMRVKL